MAFLVKNEGITSHKCKTKHGYRTLWYHYDSKRDDWSTLCSLSASWNAVLLFYMVTRVCLYLTNTTLPRTEKARWGEKNPAGKSLIWTQPFLTRVIYMTPSFYQWLRKLHPNPVSKGKQYLQDRVIVYPGLSRRNLGCIVCMIRIQRIDINRDTSAVEDSIILQFKGWRALMIKINHNHSNVIVEMAPSSFF